MRSFLSSSAAFHFVSFLFKSEMNSNRTPRDKINVQLIGESLTRASPVRKAFELVAGVLRGGVSDDLDPVPSLKKLRTSHLGGERPLNALIFSFHVLSHPVGPILCAVSVAVPIRQ